MVIYYVNIRGLKSKLDSLEEIIERHSPDIIGIVETHLGEEERIEIEGYKPIRSDRNTEGGGVMLAIKKEYEDNCVEIPIKEKVNVSVGL